MRTDTNEAPAVMLDRDARVLREAFSRCRRDVSTTQSDEYARNLAKRVGSGRVQLPEHMLTLALDGFRRHAPQDDVEAPAHVYLAIVRSWYAAARSGQVICMDALIQDVLKAQADATLAEFALRDRTPKAIADAEDALTREEIVIEKELEVLRAMRYTDAQAESVAA